MISVLQMKKRSRKGIDLNTKCLLMKVFLYRKLEILLHGEMRVLFNKLLPRRVLHLYLQQRQDEHRQSVRIVGFKDIKEIDVLQT